MCVVQIKTAILFLIGARVESLSRGRGSPSCIGGQENATDSIAINARIYWASDLFNARGQGQVSHLAGKGRGQVLYCNIPRGRVLPSCVDSLSNATYSIGVHARIYWTGGQFNA